MNSIKHPRDRLSARQAGGLILFIVLSGFLLQDRYVRGLLKDIVADSGGIDIGVLTTIWWALAAWLASGVFRHLAHRLLFPRDDQPKRRKLLADLVSGLIYLVALFGILQYAWHQPLAGMLATSGVVALVLGLALQNTLSDLFAGIALNIESPFRAGHWISVDGGEPGQIIEINWRATRLRNRSGDVMIMPNSQIARLRVINYSMTEKPHVCSISVEVAADVAPERVEPVLIAAAMAADGVMAEPPIEIDVTDIHGGVATYCVSFYVGAFALLPSIQSHVYRQILASAASNQINLALRRSEVRLAKEP